MNIKHIFRNEFFLWLSFLPTMLAPYLFFSFIASQRLEQSIAKAQAAGIDVQYQNHIPPDIPDDENGSVVIYKAISEAALKKSLLLTEDDLTIQQLNSLFDDPSFLESISDDTIDWMRNILPDYQEALLQLEPVFDRSKARHNVDYFTKVGPETVDIQGRMGLASLLCAQALIAAKNGRPEEVGKFIRKAFHLAYLVRIECPTLINELLHQNMIIRAGNALQQIEKNRAFIPETRLSLRQECLLLWDRQSLSRSFAFENAMMQWMTIGYVRQHPETVDWYDTFSVPFFTANAAALLDAHSIMVEASKKPSYLVSQEISGEEIMESIPKWAILARIALPNYGNAVRRKDISLIILQQALISFALQDYHEKQNQYPESLSLLQIPQEWMQDPFTGQDLIYQKLHEGYRIYSRGPDQEDDQGRVESNLLGQNYEGDITWSIH